MHYLNQILGGIFNILMFPFQGLHPAWGMVWISALSGLLIIVIYKHVSNQAGIRRIKKKLKAHFYELRLFKDNLRFTLAAQKDLFVANMRYLGYAFKPMLFLIIPIVLIILYLGLRYEYRGVETGEQVILSATFEDNVDIIKTEIALEVPAGVEVDEFPLRIMETNEVDWRLKVNDPGSYDIEIVVGDERYSKTLVAEASLKPVQARRQKSGIVATILHPGEKPIGSDSPVKMIKVHYPKRRFALAGISMHWLVAYFLLSVIIAFILKRPFGVQV
jgi:uncharacterized membrane protein (DUF106 family)